MTPPAPETPVQRMARITFETTVQRDAAGVPRVMPEFVAEQGQVVRILDVREPGELVGLLGHIPAATSVPMARLATVPEVLARSTLVVLVSSTGQRAGVAARYLEALGMTHVAAMDGGMAAWKKLGFSMLRDPDSYRRELRALPPGVGRDGRPLAPIEKGTRLTAGQILDHVGEPGSVRWVKLAAFLLHGKRSCVDGRDDQGVIGTPGGDAGELLLALAVTEDRIGRALTDAEVERILVAHLDTFGRFYMHSDTHAMNRLIVDGYRKDPRLDRYVAKVFEPAEWRAFHASPPPEVREVLLEHLVRPENLGCGHLKLAMTHDGYEVRPGLIEAFLRAFHRVRWAGAPELEWVVLGGEHIEGAVVEVLLDHQLRVYDKVPLVSPQVDGMQMFVAHPQVTAYLRRETAAFLVEAGVIAASDEEAVARDIGERGQRQLQATLGHLAKGLPIYVVRFASDGRAAVEAVGTV